ncbi:MAG: bis(5'-nucleosyl)-tetraphosphatase (symmetrical) YqeK [Spirochaetes bacterium]|nr:bis(5'-nucleosyl)-tetraphosphatase (symmetrical) YqeK [Spirochaetota bacterium]MCK5268616.1 bis(5'-nucleosyl)-tetraphosphatase (symmetrical) YqeK [Spirochaetota bacterium]
MTINEAESIACSFLKGRRLNHSRSVADTAVVICKRYFKDYINLYKDRLIIAGLLHDIAKPMTHEELRGKVKKYHIKVDDIICNSHALLHAPVADALLVNDFGLKDNEILNSIRFHTTGRKNMSLFEKIIYAADFVDPVRPFPQQKRALGLMENDFDESLFFMLSYTIKHVIKNRHSLHPDSVEFYNDLLLKKV